MALPYIARLDTNARSGNTFVCQRNSADGPWIGLAAVSPRQEPDPSPPRRKSSERQVDTRFHGKITVRSSPIAVRISEITVCISEITVRSVKSLFASVKSLFASVKSLFAQ